MGDRVVLHATSIALEGHALLICGATGAGKSDLALQLIAQGAELICDDRTEVRRYGEALIAHPMPNIRGLIEARGVGLLKVPVADPTAIKAIVDLDHLEDQRLPPYRTRRILDVPVPVLHKVETPSFATALRLYLQHERSAPQPET